MLETFEKFQRIPVSKRSVTRLFGIAIAFAIAGSLTGTAVAIVALANGAVSLGGPQVVSLNPGLVAGAVAGMSIASLLAGIASLAAFVAWVGALAITSRLADRSWFITLLVLGVVSGGWAAMIAYVLKGPDGTIEPAAAALPQA